MLKSKPSPRHKILTFSLLIHTWIIVSSKYWKKNFDNLKNFLFPLFFIVMTKYLDCNKDHSLIILQCFIRCSRNLVGLGACRGCTVKQTSIKQISIKEIKKIIRQICQIGCYWNGNRLSKNDEKLLYLHKITKKAF